jgi:hypothetical protein
MRGTFKALGMDACEGAGLWPISSYVIGLMVPFADP